MREVVIGIDIGGTYTKYGIVDQFGASLAEGVIATTDYPEVEAFITALDERIRELRSGIPETLSVIGAGIGAPNGNYYSGTIEFAPNLKWKGIVPFVDIFSKITGYKTVITNDANAAAIGEMIFGNAKNLKDFVVITLGTGLGSGIVSGGQLVNGHDGFAGEIGHVTYDYNGRMCGCGRKGCLETYASVTGIRRTVFELLAQKTEDSELRNVSFNDLTGKMISAAANKGDVIALEAFEITGKILGYKLADTVAHLSPEAIFLFGGLASAGDLIFQPTHKYLESHLLRVYQNKIKLLPSGVSQTNAAISGAGALAWKEFYKN